MISVFLPLVWILIAYTEFGYSSHQAIYFCSRSHLNGHPGLNRAACGGDITLAFTYKPSFDDEETSVTTKVLTSEKIEKVYAVCELAGIVQYNITVTRWENTQNTY